MHESIGRLFEEFCEFLLITEGYSSLECAARSRVSAFPPQDGPDIIVQNSRNEKIMVEVKLYRSTKAGASIVLNAIRQLHHWMQASEYTRGILVAPIAGAAKFSREDIEVWDEAKLCELAAKAGLSGILDKFLKSHFSSPIDPAITQALDLIRDVRCKQEGGGTASTSVPDIRQKRDEATASRSSLLLGALAECKAGRADAKKFEEVCFDSLRFLFGEDFEGWLTQNRVEGGFHIHDIVARLNPEHDFWSWVSHDFCSRYVIFEVKNYSEAISQNQIYTTEKYLYAGALRRVAILVARNGCDAGGERAIKAALREHGKLIAWLTLDELTEMISLKQKGEEYIMPLSDRVDSLLTDLSA